MSALNRLFASFGQSRQPDHAPDVRLRRVVKSLRALRTRTNGETLSIAAAESGKPISGVITELGTAYCGELKHAEALYDRDVGTQEAQQAHLEARMTPARLDAVERTGEIDHARLLGTSQPNLIRLRRIERAALLAYRAFRCRFKLVRDAVYPTKLALHFKILALMWLCEDVANTAAFADGSELGLLGGFLAAGLVAAVNVAFAFFVGRAASGLFHHHPGIKALGALVVSAWVAFEVYFALGVAHYRIALVDNTETASVMALERLLTMPWAVNDVISVLLSVFTIAFGIGAVFAGLSTDDRVPGYGRVTRAFKAAGNKLSALRESIMGSLDALYQSSAARLEAVVMDTLAMQDAYRHTSDEMKRTMAELTHVVAAVNSAHQEQQLSARRAYADVRGQSADKAEPEVLAPSTLQTRLAANIVHAERVKATFPASLAELETKKAATEARIQHRHAQALKQLPAYFADADAIAVEQTAQDEAAPAKAAAASARARQEQSSFDDVAEDAPHQQPDAESDEVDLPSTPTGKGTSKLNGADKHPAH